MRLRKRAFGATLGVLCLALAACGSHGVAAQLGQPVTVTLSEAAAGGATTSAAVTLTPIHATHIAAYYAGHAIPLTGATTPAQVRQNACTGPVVVNLSDGLPPGAATTASATPPATQADPSGGLDVAIEPGSQWYVIVYDRANDPAASIVACGHPLSGNRQYFDLYEAAKGPDGIALGTALFDPIAATGIDVAVTGAASGGASMRWALHSGGCSGPTLAGGATGGGSAHASAVVFRPIDTTGWWVTLTQASGTTTCGKVGA